MFENTVWLSRKYSDKICDELLVQRLSNRVVKTYQEKSKDPTYQEMQYSLLYIKWFVH